MAYPEKALGQHPFANPGRGWNGHSGYVRAANRKTGIVGVLDASRWLPHQGEREIARRAAKEEAV